MTNEIGLYDSHYSQLAADPQRLGNAEWGPDSSTIFFKRYDGEGRTSFWSVPAAGGAARSLH